jgi:hypothetical protein
MKMNDNINYSIYREFKYFLLILFCTTWSASGAKFTNEEIKKTPTGYLMTGLNVGGIKSPPAQKNYSYEIEVKREDDHTVSLHVEITYLRAQAHYLQISLSFPFEWKNKSDKYEKIGKDTSVELVTSSGQKQKHSLYMNDMPPADKVKMATFIRNGALSSTVKPGRNTSMRLYDPRNGGDDRQQLYMIVSPNADTSVDARVGERSSFEITWETKKIENNETQKDGTSTNDSFSGTITKIDQGSRSITIKTDASAEESTYIIDEKTKILLNKSQAAFFLLQPGMKVRVLPAANPAVALTVEAATN